MSSLAFVENINRKCETVSTWKTIAPYILFSVEFSMKCVVRKEITSNSYRRVDIGKSDVSTAFIYMSNEGEEEESGGKHCLINIFVRHQSSTHT